MLPMLPHQTVAKGFLEINQYVILADNMGLGKTRSSIEASRNCTKLLVVCPAYLKANWIREISKWGFNKLFNICSYEYVASGKAEIYLENCSHIIIDECHYIKNIDSNRTKAIHFYIQKYKPTNVYLLSGTPIKNRIPEFYSLLMICSYGNIQTRIAMAPYNNYWAFCNKFSIPESKIIYGRKITKYSGHRNTDELKTIMSTCYLRRLKMDIDLPSMRDIEVFLDIEKEVPSDELFESFVKTNKPSTALASLKAKNALLKAPHTAKFCEELIGEGQCEQIVVFCDHIDSTKVLAKILGVSPITGEVSLENRDIIVQDFINKKSQYLVTTIGTSSTGLNLVNTHVMVFNSFPWVGSDIEQAKKRINRIGQDKDCLYYYIIAGAVDERILKVVRSKEKTLSAVL